MKELLTLAKSWLETSTRRQKWTAALTVFGLLCTLGLTALNRGAEAPGSPLGSTPLYFIGAFLKLGLVLLLILGSSILLRRWMQNGLPHRRGRQLQLIETVRLSPKQAIHLLSVGDEQLLIGATDQSVTLLSRVQVDLAEIAVPAPDFGSLLRSMDLHFPSAASK